MKHAITKKEEPIALFMHKAAVSHSIRGTIVATALFTNTPPSTVEELKTGPKRMGPFENVGGPPEGMDHSNFTTFISTNVVNAITKSSEPAGPLRNDNIDTTHRNVLATKNPDPPSNLYTPST